MDHPLKNSQNNRLCLVFYANNCYNLFVDLFYFLSANSSTNNGGVKNEEIVNMLA